MTTGPERASVGEIVGRVVGQMQGLIRGEIDLAKAQAKEKVAKLGAGAGMFAGAAFFGITFYLLAVTAAVLALSLVLPAWAAALIVGAVFLVLAIILGLLGKSAFDKANQVEIKPADGLKQTAEAFKTGLTAHTKDEGERL